MAVVSLQNSPDVVANDYGVFNKKGEARSALIYVNIEDILLGNSNEQMYIQIELHFPRFTCYGLVELTIILFDCRSYIGSKIIFKVSYIAWKCSYLKSNGNNKEGQQKYF